jgi:putative transferase (TIGR04331 family)
MNVFAFTDLPISDIEDYDKIYHNNIFWLNFNESKSRFINVNNIDYFESNDLDTNNIMILYDKLLDVVTENLSVFHNRTKSLRYYRIFFGSTLYMLATSYYYSTKNLKYLKSFFLEESDVKLIFYHLSLEEILSKDDLVSFITSREGLQYVYQLLILNDQSYKFLAKRIIWKTLPKNNFQNPDFKHIFKEKIKRSYFSLLNISLARKETIFFSSTESVFKIIFNNLFSNVYYYNFCEKKIKFNYKSVYKFELTNKTSPENLIVFLNCLFPKQYLLKKEELNKIFKAYKLPNTIINIVTTDLFKGISVNAYIAEQVNGGSKLYCIQHGGGYKVHKFMTHEFHERKVSDVFISAGIANSKNYNFPESKIINFNLYRKIYDFKFEKDNSENNFITIQFLDNYYSEYFPASDITPKFMKNYFNIIDELLSKSELKPFNKLNFKLQLYPRISTYDYYNYYKNKFKNLKFWPLGVGQNEVYKNSKLIVLTYFSTAILELAYHNRPFVLILNSRINYSCSVQKTIDDFVESDIVHYDTDSLLNFLNATNIDKWFHSAKIQKVINKFKIDYVWISKYDKFDINKLIK